MSNVFNSPEYSFSKYDKMDLQELKEEKAQLEGLAYGPMSKASLEAFAALTVVNDRIRELTSTNPLQDKVRVVLPEPVLPLPQTGSPPPNPPLPPADADEQADVNRDNVNAQSNQAPPPPSRQSKNKMLETVKALKRAQSDDKAKLEKAAQENPQNADDDDIYVDFSYLASLEQKRTDQLKSRPPSRQTSISSGQYMQMTPPPSRNPSSAGPTSDVFFFPNDATYPEPRDSQTNSPSSSPSTISSGPIENRRPSSKMEAAKTIQAESQLARPRFVPLEGQFEDKNHAPVTVFGLCSGTVSTTQQSVSTQFLDLLNKSVIQAPLTKTNYQKRLKDLVTTLSSQLKANSTELEGSSSTVLTAVIKSGDLFFTLSVGEAAMKTIHTDTKKTLSLTTPPKRPPPNWRSGLSSLGTIIEPTMECHTLREFEQYEFIATTKTAENISTVGAKFVADEEGDFKAAYTYAAVEENEETEA